MLPAAAGRRVTFRRSVSARVSMPAYSRVAPAGSANFAYTTSPQRVTKTGWSRTPSPGRVEQLAASGDRWVSVSASQGPIVASGTWARSRVHERPHAADGHGRVGLRERLDEHAHPARPVERGVLDRRDRPVVGEQRQRGAAALAADGVFPGRGRELAVAHPLAAAGQHGAGAALDARDPVRAVVADAEAVVGVVALPPAHDAEPGVEWAPGGVERRLHELVGRQRVGDGGRDDGLGLARAEGVATGRLAPWPFPSSKAVRSPGFPARSASSVMPTVLAPARGSAVDFAGRRRRHRTRRGGPR